MNLTQWEPIFANWLTSQMAQADGAHDTLHIKRVVKMAKSLANEESADLDVVVPAAWLHDCVIVDKGSDKRPFASRMAAEAAGHFLQENGYPQEKISDIQHAIAAHSFSAQIPPETIEAKVVQDADRLDALGAIGVARAMLSGSSFNIPLYHETEPIPSRRDPNEKGYVLDHFFTKLLKLEEMMQTESGRREASKRTHYMHHFLNQLASEV